MALTSFKSMEFADRAALAAWVADPINGVTTVHQIMALTDGSGLWVLFYS